LLQLLLLLAAASASGAAPAARTLAVAWNDVGTGTGLLQGMRTVSPWPFVTPAIAIGRFASLRSANGKVFAVSGHEDQIAVVAADTWTLERLVRFGSGERPVDIAVADPDTAYVTRAATGQLLRLDLSDGSMWDVLDLSVFADADGNPDLGWMAIHEGRLFVQIRRAGTAGFVPPAYLAVVDLATEQLIDVDPDTPGVQAIELEGTAARRNMQILLETRQLAVMASGGYLDEGGIELIDLDALESEGLVVDEAVDETGTDLLSFLFTRPDRGYFNAMTDIILSSHLVAFSVSQGVDTTQLNGALDYDVATMVYDHHTDTFFLPEGGIYGDGIRVFDADDGAQLTKTILPTNGDPTGVVIVCNGIERCPEPLCAAPGACRPIPAMSAWACVALSGLMTAVVGLAFGARTRHGRS
jgi:hypothetical protein